VEEREREHGSRNTSFGRLALKGLDKKKVATNCIDTSTDTNKETIKK
jgi:hypothetical protein